MRSSSGRKVGIALSGPHASVTSAAHTNDVWSSGSSGGSSMLNTSDAAPPVAATPRRPVRKRPRRQRQRRLLRVVRVAGFFGGAPARAGPAFLLAAVFETFGRGAAFVPRAAVHAC